MKEKAKPVILLFFISLILIPSFIFGASSRRTMNLQSVAVDKGLIKIKVTPPEVTLPDDADEAALRNKIVVTAFYRSSKEGKVVQDYTTDFNKLKSNQGVKKVAISYTADGCTKKASVCISFVKPPVSQGEMTQPNAGEAEDINFPYISGYPDKTFRPNQPVTREELAAMLARLITKNQIPAEANVYTDLTPGRFSTDAINYITKLGIMKPVSGQTFDPKGTVTDNEFREIIDRAQSYIKDKKVQLPEGTSPLTRVEAVTALNALFNVQCNTSYTSSPFTDVSPKDQGYSDILCATQSRIEPRKE